jgi:H+/Cl- antiporter ClcA
MKQTLYTNLIFWTLSILLIGVVVGSASALFLVTLDLATATRTSSNVWILLLPLGGAIIGIGYHYLAKGVEKESNLLISEMIEPKHRIHWKLAPIVMVGTVLTHLFGGSAGREGTAVQMGGAIADQFGTLFKRANLNRKILLRMGVAAGFAGVFGTPIAGVLFAFELDRKIKLDVQGFTPIILVSILADYVCQLWGVEHTSYAAVQLPDVSFTSIGFVLIIAVVFGLTAMVFSLSKKYLTSGLKQYMPNDILRISLGGGLIALVALIFNFQSYLGLGIPIIEEAFTAESGLEVFAIKVLFTVFTLSVGFKGGEATPLFFIGATLGSALAMFVPLPTSFLAGLGFIAVFAGATNSPLACAAMGMEMFGPTGGLWYLLVCVIAFYTSGKTTVYSAQSVHLFKYNLRS